MKTAQELRAGNVVIIDNQPIIVHKAEYNQASNTAGVMKFKFRNLLTGTNSELICKPFEKFNDVILDTKTVTFSYEDNGTYVFMDEDYNQYEFSADDIEAVLKYLEDQMTCDVTFYDGKPLSVAAPVKIVREIVYTEPAVRGDTSGKVMKPGRLPSGYEIMVPAFVEMGDKVEIDTRTDEYVSRVK